jgi:hypothetical protein
MGAGGSSVLMGVGMGDGFAGEQAARITPRMTIPIRVLVFIVRSNLLSSEQINENTPEIVPRFLENF